MKTKEKFQTGLVILLLVSMGLVSGFLVRGCVDTQRQIKLDLGKTEIRMRVDEINEILSLIEDLMVVVEQYESTVEEVLTYRNGELENRIRFRDVVDIKKDGGLK